jgi:acyl-coenzyme A synthetase/AMP-(fatty) acid ligase
VNFARDVVESTPAPQRALICIDQAGARRDWTMGEVARFSRTVAAHLHERGVRRGDVVLTLLGNQPAWVLTMVACFRQGYVVLPCTEQLRAKDLRLRLDARPGDLVWCTAASGWSKSARNAFIAPWLRGAAAHRRLRRRAPRTASGKVRRAALRALT